jgi:hypothetical protein
MRFSSWPPVLASLRGDDFREVHNPRFRMIVQVEVSASVGGDFRRIGHSHFLPMIYISTVMGQPKHVRAFNLPEQFLDL